MGAAIDIAVACARAAVFAASMQAAGAALFLLLFKRRSASIDGSVRSLIFRSAGVAAVLILARSALEPARMAGDLSGVVDPFLQSLFWGSDVRVAQTVRLAGVALLLVTATARQPWTGTAWALAVALVVASFTLMGHTRAHDGGVALGLLLTLHLAAVVFWFGALVPLVLLLRNGPAEAVVGALGDFSRLAVWSVPVLLGAGVAVAWMLLGSFDALTTPYGILLLVKLAGFTGLLALAAINRFRLTPAVGAGVAHATIVMRRLIQIELALMALVFVATAFLTTLFSPS